MGVSQLNRILLTVTLREHIDQASPHNLSEKCLRKTNSQQKGHSSCFKCASPGLLTEPWPEAQTG